MQKIILSQKTRKAISKRVWSVWVFRKSMPLVGLTALVLVESLFVSFTDVALNMLAAADSIKTLSAYVASAVVNTELYVLAGAIVLFVGGVVFVRNTIRDFQLIVSLRRERVSVR